MEAVKFTLSGRFAFFKKPEFNNFGKGAHHYITFNQIPKTAVLGIIGSLIGLNSFEYKNNFFDKLKDVKISVIPKEPHFIKDKHRFADSSGLFFLSKGANIIIEEEILCNPEWDIIISEDSPYYEKIKDYLQNKKSVYHLFLGKNEFFANISNVEVVEVHANKSENKEKTLNDDMPKMEMENNYSKNLDNDNGDYIKIDSVFISKRDLIKEDLKKSHNSVDKNFLYKEFLPVSFDENQNYIYDLFYFTNQLVNKELVKNEIFVLKDSRNILKNIVFF